MSDPVFPQLRDAVGADAVERDPAGLPRVVPDSTDAVAQVVGLARERGWRLRVEGRGAWLPADAPADLALSTRALDTIDMVSPADLVVGLQAGVSLEALRRRLGDDGMWLALDPPGRPERSLGSVLATASSGPLRQGFGPVRDHVLGLTVVTGDARVVRSGGRVVKNVAGFDLTKLHVGGFGAFGIVTECTLRLRAMPRADRTLVARGDRDRLTAVARDLTEARLALGALELFSPALAAESDWVLAARLLGTEDGVQAESQRLAATGAVAWQELPAERAGTFWHLAARATLGGAVSLRLGVLQEGLDDTLDLVAATLDEGLVAAGAGSAGGLRWSGEAAADALRSLRRAAASREIPLTLERAPWGLRRAVGHFGAYREGVGQLVHRLRETFDPAGILAVALEGE
ncbi:MAG: FAD-binding oxidoreductase [Gemmatimonadales bacterium]|jgi:glycolate oxidase FAD binding subunit|nr:FAD-binding oxidoreductase [Gemmatimonadales bacterium]